MGGIAKRRVWIRRSISSFLPNTYSTLKEERRPLKEERGFSDSLKGQCFLKVGLNTEHSQPASAPVLPPWTLCKALTEGGQYEAWSPTAPLPRALGLSMADPLHHRVHAPVLSGR